MSDAATAFAGLVAIAGARVRLTHLSKATLIDLSHVLEDMVEEHGRSGVVMTGFQYASRWLAQVDRYERLARTDGRDVAIFTRDRVDDPVAVLPYRIGPGSGLAEEWFVLVRTSSFSCALFGQDCDGDSLGDLSELDRRFESGWSFDPELVDELSRHVLGQAESDGQDVSALTARLDAVPFTPITGELFQHFYTEVFLCLEADKARLRESREREARANALLQRSNARMLRLERLSTIGTTAASFAHEVNNPLQIILGQIDSIRWELSQSPLGDGPDAAEFAQLREAIEAAGADVSASTQRIGRLTRGVLDMVRDEDVELREADLAHWLRRNLQRIGTTLDLEVRQTIRAPRAVARVDEDRLLHVLTNLLENAVEAGAGRVEVTLSSDAAQLVMSVRDDGPGVSEAIRDRLFQPFVSSRIGRGGTGLGLALSRRFVEDMSGRLDLADSGPAGTCFEISLPHPPNPAANDAGAEAARGPRALVIDDEEPLRRTLASMLERHGFEVTCSVSAAQAEPFLEGEAIELCIVDFDLGEGPTGADLVEAWQAGGRFPATRFLLVSGNLQSTLPSELPAPLLLKPFDEQALISVVERVLT